MRAWLNCMNLCRKMVSNRHLQRGQKINKKAYTKKGSSKVSVCIFCRPCAGKWNLTDTLQWGESQNMKASIVWRLQRVYQGHFSCTDSAKRQTDTKLLKICKSQTLSEVSVSFSMTLCVKMNLTDTSERRKNDPIEGTISTSRTQIPRARAWM